MPHAALRIAGVVGAVALFCGAYAFPAIGTCSRDAARSITWFDNSTLLFFGWLGPFSLQVGWFANLGFLRQLVTLARGSMPGRRALILHAVVLAIGCVTLLPPLGLTLWHNEAWSEPICQLGAGFWLWLAAQLLVLGIASLEQRTRHLAAPIQDLP